MRNAMCNAARARVCLGVVAAAAAAVVVSLFTELNLCGVCALRYTQNATNVTTCV